MARKVRNRFSQIRPDIHKVIAGKGNLSTTAIYNRLKKKRIKPDTPISELKRIAKRKGNANKVNIKISTNMRGQKLAEAIALKERNKKGKERHTIVLHPYLKYRNKPYINDVINHEIDHIKVFRKKRKRR